ncbi:MULTISPECIES: glycosyltransferase [Bacteroides]|uniref:glycosyltransferase n=1 Tax=Bacteroides TaxID=816 RepID=UPI000E445852|nr:MULTISPECIES: glycosyltransferase [Bacteroides]MBS7575676.1 glycosyltransferase [Bacteroides propionicigenes]RGM25601.1 glycosyltransferase [Bacteroides sp. OM08-17BH]HBO06980.1 hypothetical protein [Bacteroides sp.]
MILTKENSCAVIVTFNPDSLFEEAIKRHIELFGFIIVVDNNSSDLSFLKHCIVDTVLLKKNMGIAYALNIGIRRALSSGYKWIFTFDQDSIPIRNFLYYYNEVFRVLPEDLATNIGLISTKHVPNVPFLLDSNLKFKRTCSLITSGMFHNGRVFERVGWYDEKMFIDGVDFEFALRCSVAGFDTIRIQNPILQHKLGDPQNKSVMWGLFNIKTTNHNATRRYYIMRNHIYIFKKYVFKRPLWIFKKSLFCGIDLIVMLLADDDKWDKIKKTLKGLVDGFVL